jgi:superfamily I DNA and/or RNA helicase
LPPTVLSRPALDDGLGISLLERLVEHFGTLATRRLQVQYRMHEAIMAFSARWFYRDDLRADSTVARHLLSELPGVTANDLTDCPLHFVDTAGASFEEESEADGDSKFNLQEAALVARHVERLLTAGVSAADVAVIAPYAAQVRLLRERLTKPGLEIDSVDGFQGREKEAVVVSLVRSNLQTEIGFLADVRRMNVALTRARRKLIVVGDSATLAVHPFYRELFAYFEQVGAHHSVWEEP